MVSQPFYPLGIWFQGFPLYFGERLELCQTVLHNILMNDAVRKYMSEMGKKGGSKKSAKKALACRLNAIKRWADVKEKKNVKN